MAVKEKAVLTPQIEYGFYLKAHFNLFAIISIDVQIA